MADSYAEGMLTVDFDATVTSDEPMFDALTGQTTTQMVMDDPPEHFAFQVGYDAQGAFAYEHTATDPVGDPLTQSVDDVRTVRVRKGQMTLLNAAGGLASGTTAAGTSIQTLLAAQNADPLVVLDGLVLTSFPPVGSVAYRAGPNATSTTATVTSVTQSGDVTTVATTVQTEDPAVPDLPQRRVYVRRGSEHVLSEVQTDVAAQATGFSVAGRATIRFEQVVFSRNAQKDQARRAGTGTNAWTGGVLASSSGTPAPPCQPSDIDSGLCDPPPPVGPGGGSSGCTTTTGGANLVYVHGIRSNGAAWGSGAAGTSASGGVVGPVRCALRIATEATPSLGGGLQNGEGTHAAQATELLPTARAFPQPIFVAHSQGGLISRRAAQEMSRLQPGSVRAVVTTGTPHAGAPIANTLNPGGGLGGVLRVFGGGAACRIVGCSPVSAGFLVLRDAYLSSYSSPAMADLRPNSDAMRAVNLPTESFPRYGITNAIPKRWAVARVGGDLLSDNSGEQKAQLVKTVFRVAVAGSIIGSFIPFFHPAAAALAFVAAALDQTDRWWTRITVGGEQGDGVVPLPSQSYPSGALNYPAPVADAASHTGQVDTGRSAIAIKRVLNVNVGVAIR